MKARIYIENPQFPNYVTVEKDSEYSDSRESTVYFCPVGGGYVRIADDAGSHPQVCEALSGAGSTLHCSNPENLIKIIRREHKKRMVETKEYRF